MRFSNNFKEKLACAYYFAAPALVYGVFTSRLPALKNMAGIGDGQVGMVLLALGLATLAGLIACSLVVDRLGAKNILGLSTICMIGAFIASCLASNLWLMILCCLIGGIAVGFADVAMNAQGICIEIYRRTYCLSFLHGCSSLGGVAGSLSGSFFASLGLSPFWNMVIITGVFLCFLPLASRATNNFASSGPANKKIVWRGVAFAVYLCGIFSLVCHIVEGAAAEWGSIFLHTEKGASQSEAALVFAAFTGAMVACRMGGDKLRKIVGDGRLIFWGALFAACGMALALLATMPWICLAGYGIMGAGLGPIVPILFARAGASPSVTPGAASGIVSVFSYAGLLLFPPFLGILGSSIGLTRVLWVLVALCLFLMPAVLLVGTAKKNSLG